MARGAASTTRPANLTTRERQAKCLELRIMGHTLEEIAASTGYSSAASVSNAISSALKRREKPLADELAAIHMARLEVAAKKVMGKLVKDGLSTRAIGQATLALQRILAQQSRYVDVYSQGQGLGPVVSLLEKLLDPANAPDGADPDDSMTVEIVSDSPE